MVIRTATLENLENLTSLFNAYRIFYKQPDDLIRSGIFMHERLSQNDSVIFIAFIENRIVGFSQLYPTYSSVSMERYYILNDLFVEPNERNHGVGKALLLHAQEFVTKSELKGLSLETGIGNPAQFLYEKLGWEKDEHHYHYFWKNRPE